ncbi:MAG TPA: SRPBCC domain-containing protein [Xanthobacteraceae bacterium]
MADNLARAEAHADLKLTRLIDAPRALVFKMWTEAEHLAQWFGPRQVTLPFCNIEPRPGGTLHFCHRLDDGTEVWVKGVYREVVAPERLVFSLSFVDSDGRAAAHPMIPDWPLDTVILTTVTFADRHGKTALDILQQILPPQGTATDAVRRERQAARTGWGETLDRLAEYVGRVA